MPEIIVALIAAGATIGAAVIGVAGVRRNRSRATETTPTEALSSQYLPDASDQSGATTSSRTQNAVPGGVTINANNARQVIGRNDGEVTQINHYGSKRKR